MPNQVNLLFSLLLGHWVCTCQYAFVGASLWWDVVKKFPAVGIRAVLTPTHAWLAEVGYLLGDLLYQVFSFLCMKPTIQALTKYISVACAGGALCCDNIAQLSVSCFCL